MCRWFAYVSGDEECLLEDVLITPKHSLVKQVENHYLPKLLSHDPENITSEHEINARNRLFNTDGLGLAWYTYARETFEKDTIGPRPALYKCIQPPLHDTVFRSICANTTTKACFSHIRAATGSPITPTNNHPFVFGRHSIMHNGVISDFGAISRQMCLLMDDDCYGNIHGSTDSEHLAALYMTYLVNGKGAKGWEERYSTSTMETALRKTVAQIIKLQQDIMKADATPNSLNVATTDGEQLLAYRFRNSAVQQPPSLYYSTTAGVTLNRKYPDHPDAGVENPGATREPSEHGSHVIVASEPSTYKDKEWDLIPKNHYVAVEKGCGQVRVAQIEYEQGWDAKGDGIS
ncbi:MAG: hypothetical protein M1827_000372 [Pycnora praestabilis]|nr:MAG: hypothetical protein M1827_000372 [Pycnora praestabilis]